MDIIIKYIKKYKEQILYLVFGGLTTLINIIVFFITNKVLNISWQISNILAWFFAVLFAYIVNRKFVFESKNENVLKEMISFFFFRILSLFIDMAVMFIFIDIIKLDSAISKLLVQFIIVVVNYIFSKLIIFNK